MFQLSSSLRFILQSGTRVKTASVTGPVPMQLQSLPAQPTPPSAALTTTRKRRAWCLASDESSNAIRGVQTTWEVNISTIFKSNRTFLSIVHFSFLINLIRTTISDISLPRLTVQCSPIHTASDISLSSATGETHKSRHIIFPLCLLSWVSSHFISRSDLASTELVSYIWATRDYILHDMDSSGVYISSWCFTCLSPLFSESLFSCGHGISTLSYISCVPNCDGMIRMIKKEIR